MSNYNMKVRSIAILMLIIVSGSTASLAQLSKPLNLDLEKYMTNLTPYVWSFDRTSEEFNANTDTTVAFSGRSSFRVSVLPAAKATPHFIYNFLYQGFKNHKTIRIEAEMQIHSVGNHVPRLYIFQSGKLHYQNEGKALNNHEFEDKWQKVVVDAKIDTSSKQLMFGFTAWAGTVWVDDFHIFLDGVEQNDLPFIEPIAPKISEFSWLPKFSHQIDTTNFNNVNLLPKHVKQASVIGLGESMHGSHDIFVAKSVFVKDLIRNHGFDVLAFETPMSEAHELNRYIINGKGDLKELMNNKYLFSIYDVKEVFDLLNWIKKENLNRTNKIHFEGVDVQAVDLPLANLKIGLATDQVADSLLSTIASTITKSYYRPDQGALDRLLNLILLVSKRMTEDKIKDEWLAHDLTLVRYFVNYSENYRSRDSLMAQNVLFLKKYYHNSKILFWGHNSHIQFGDGKSTGSFLRSKLRSDYQAIGFSTASGRNRLFSEYGTRIMKLEEPYAGTVEYYLSSVPFNNYYLDVAGMRSDNGKFSQLSGLDFRGIGFEQSIDPQFLEMNFDLRQRFDGLIFVKKSVPSVLIN